MDLKPETKKVNGENWSVWETERVSDKETDSLLGFVHLWS